MDEWIDKEEKERRQQEAFVKKLLVTLTKDIRTYQMFSHMFFLLCALNVGLGLRSLIHSWTVDQLWTGIVMALFSVSVGVLVGWVAFRLRRRVRNLRNLRKSFVGAMTAQTLIQLEHHKGQGKAALRDLIANR